MKKLLNHPSQTSAQTKPTYLCMYKSYQKVPNVKRGNESTNGKQTSQGTYLERFLVDALCVFPRIARFCVHRFQLSLHLESSILDPRYFLPLRFCCRVFTFSDPCRRRRRSSRSCDMVRKLGKVPVHILSFSLCHGWAKLLLFKNT